MRGYFQPDGFDLVDRHEVLTFGPQAAVRIWAAVHLPKLGFSLPPEVPRNTSFYGSFDSFTPFTVSLELTDRCNANCAFYYRDSDPHKSHVLTDWQSILNALSDAGVYHVQLTGGEPFLHPDFMNIFEVALGRFEMVTVLTNGYRIDEKFVRLAGKRKDSVHVQFDLDSTIPELHDKLRGLRGLYRRVMRAAGLLRTHGVPFRIAMNVVDENASEVPAVCNMARDLGAGTFIPTPILAMGRATAAVALTEVGARAMRSGMDDVSSRLETFVSRPKQTCGQPDATSARDACGACRRLVAIGPDAKVRPCVLWPTNLAPLGDLSQQDLGQCLTSQAAQSVSTLPTPGSDKCDGCKHWSFCFGCIARAAVRAQENRCWFYTNLPSSSGWQEKAVRDETYASAS